LFASPPILLTWPAGKTPLHGLAFLQDLAVVMIAAALAAVLCHRLRQPVVLGYILAGLLIGPHTPPASFIQNEESIATLAELGIVFLMFSLGLEFNLRKLRAVGSTAVLASGLEIVLMVAVGYQIGRWFGWTTMDSLFLGAMLSISSTTIIVKALGELGLSKEPFARLIFGILIIEDLLAIVMLALLSGIAMTGSLGLAQAGATIGKLSVFLAATLVAGLVGVPRFLGFVGRFRSNELLLISVLGLCFGCSLLAAKLGYSTALGAFLMGAVVAESRELGRVEHLIEPVRDLFSAIFFVAIGMQIDPRLLVEYALPIAILSVAVIVGKVVTCSVGTFVAGNDARTSLKVGMGLAQIGEFSFIIATLGQSLQVTQSFLYPIAVAVSAVTTLTTPALIRGAEPLVGWMGRSAPMNWVAGLRLYTQWVGRLGNGSPTSHPSPSQPTPTSVRLSRLIRRWILQLALNLTLVAAVFLVAVYFEAHEPAWLPARLREPRFYHGVLWLSAVILTLPLFIATFRKLQALGMVIAELRVSRAAAGARTQAIRTVVSQGIALAGLAGLVFYAVALSSTLLPARQDFLLFSGMVGLLTLLLWRGSIRLYSRAQIALSDTLNPVTPHPDSAADPDASTAFPPAPARPPAPALLRDADLASVEVPNRPHVAGRLIRELALRTRTGATIVGLDRGGRSIVNPGPDEELQAGDRVILLGHPSELAAARAHLTGEP
jgi:CPA2 family monovalent cation:H+ antiporter-2